MSTSFLLMSRCQKLANLASIFDSTCLSSAPVEQHIGNLTNASDAQLISLNNDKQTFPIYLLQFLQGVKKSQIFAHWRILVTRRH